MAPLSIDMQKAVLSDQSVVKDVESGQYVSTHSRPKAAGIDSRSMRCLCLRFNSQPPEGGWTSRVVAMILENVSTHSRPKAAGQM